MKIFRLAGFLPALVFAAFTCASPALAAPEAFEIGPDTRQLLPGGKEADGIIGDFVLRNNRVEAVVSGNLPLRRANMSTFYGTNGITPGCLYDLTLRGANNDQLVIFTPSAQQGPVSYVRVAKDGRDGEAVVETVVTAANNGGLYKRHEYRLRDDWQGLFIVTTYRNEGKTNRTGSVDDRWMRFAKSGKARDIAWGDANDPADKAGYAYAWRERDGFTAPPKEISLAPGEELTVARFLAVGHSPLEAFGILAAERGPTGVVAGRLTDASGAPVLTAKIETLFGTNRVPAYPDATGGFSVRLPVDEYEIEISDLGRETIKRTLAVKADATTRLDTQLSAASAVVFDVRGETGKSIPCKAQFIGINGTKNPNLGPQDRAHGCVDQYHSEKGTFRVQLPPGDYRIIVTRGIEFSHLDQTIQLSPGATPEFKGVLKRLVDTRGWVSADYHNHSTPSGDNVCGTDDRVINLAAEHIEFAPTTEHARFYDWRPHIERLGLRDEINTIAGVELSGDGPHFNAFPFEPVPFTQDNGAPPWVKDPRLNAVILRDFQGVNPSRWVQINHPDMVENFIDRDGDGRVDGGYLGLGQLIDGLETQNYGASGILGGVPFKIGRDTKTGREAVQYVREFIWLQLLNRGHRYSAVAVCDAHSVYGNGVGGWRMYTPSASDEPAKIDWQENIRHAKAGRIILTSGPFLQVQTEDGILPGATTRASGSINLKVKVQCTDWIDIDRVQVLVNGRPRADVNFTRKSNPQFFADGVVKFDRLINVPLSEDAHLIVVAYGENFDLQTGYGTSPQAKLKPCAYNNPIFVDVDGDGFKPNGDTLDFALPVKKITVPEARRILGQN